MLQLTEKVSLGFEVLMRVTMKFTMFCDVTLATSSGLKSESRETERTEHVQGRERPRRSSGG
jgi:hypothetical protein